MIQIYCGEGKGKTTCAFGLALRSAGRGMQVVIAQFLKGADSGERLAMARVPNVKLLELPAQMKFTFQMDDAERREAAGQMEAMLEEAEALIRGGACDLLILDECCAAVSTGLLPLERVTGFLDGAPKGLETVITGRDPAPQLLARADYITEMRKIKHPFDAGVPARKGIEW